MAIYIGTKRIDGGGSSDPSILKLATNYDASTQLYSIPVFCSSTNGNLISPLINTINEDYYNSLRIIPHFNNDGLYISNINNYVLNDSLNIKNELYPGIEIYFCRGARIISSETGHIGDAWFSMNPIWDGGYIQCKLWDGYKNDASSSKSMWYYPDTNIGYLYPQIYTTSTDSYTSSGYYELRYPNTILDLTNETTLGSGIVLNIYKKCAFATIIVRENSPVNYFNVGNKTIVYGPNFMDNAAKGSSGDPSTLVCYSLLKINNTVLVNSCLYKPEGK